MAGAHERRRWRLVVFDFDGTLCDSFDWFCGVLNDVADRYGFRRVESEAERDALRLLGAREIVGRLGVPLWKLPMIARHMHGLAARDADRIGLFPDVPPMLAAIAASGLPMALLSSNDEANVRRILGPENAGLFARFACGASLFGKASRLAALVRASGVPPAAVLCVGDEIRDGEAARAVGCGFAAVAWGYNGAAALAALDPEVMAERPGEIAAALGANSEPSPYSPRLAPGTTLAPVPLPKGS